VGGLDKAAPETLRDPTTPENVLANLESLYNDTRRPAAERLALYADLLAEDFLFVLDPDDVERGLPATWGRAIELDIHRRMFEARTRREIRALALALSHQPARDLEPPQVGREGWKEILVPAVNLRLLFTSFDGYDVAGTQARFLFAPAPGGRWRIAEWQDLPGRHARGTGTASVDGSTWGAVKALYLDFDPPGAEPLLPATRPEHVVRNLEVLYNDRLRSAGRRGDAFGDLLAPGFVFHLQPIDVDRGLPASWGAATEAAAHRALFGAQARREVRALELVLDAGEPHPLDPPEPGREGWQEVVAPAVVLRLETGPWEGIEVTGSGARFLLAPAGERWLLGAWYDVPRPADSRAPAPPPAAAPSPPGPARRALDALTWGSLKQTYLEGGRD
jgi:hypothetical protein